MEGPPGPPMGMDFDFQVPPGPPLGMDFANQGPLNFDAGFMPPQGFLSGDFSQDLPQPDFPENLPVPGFPQWLPLGFPPGPLDGLNGSDQMPPDGLPLGMPPGFPPDGMPPDFALGLPPGLPPGFTEGAFAEGPGRPDFVGPAGIGPPPSGAPPSGIGPPPPGPPPAWALAAGMASTEPERKRKRSGVDGLAPNRNIKNSGGSVTVYNGYEGVALTAKKDPASKASAAPAAPAAPATASSSVFGAVQGQEALPRQLPEGWEMKKSRSTGKVYYINEKLGKSQFDPPAGSSLKAGSKDKKQKPTLRPKVLSGAATTSDSNGVVGAVRAGDKNVARWQKWQKCSNIVNAESPEKDLH